MRTVQPRSPRQPAQDQKASGRPANWIGPIVLSTLIVLLALPLSALLWIATADWQDPIAELPRPTGSGTVERLAETAANDRIITDWRLSDAMVGRAHYVVDRPAATDTPVPVIILLGGAPRGRQALQYMSTVGDNAVLSIDWPMPVPDKLPRGWGLLPAAPALRRDILNAPGQITAVYEWLSHQPWVDKSRISLVGVSLGAMIAPSAQFLIAEITGRDAPFAATLLAFGGVDIQAMIEGNPSLQETMGQTRLHWLGWTAAKLLAPIEPELYLPQLSGQFLVVNASRDGVIPQALVNRLTNMVPEPKDTVTIAGGHIGPDPETPRILRTLNGIATGWMLGLDVVNPP